MTKTPNPTSGLRAPLLRAVVALVVAALFVLGTASAQSGLLRVGSEIPVQLDTAFASSDSEILVLNTVYDYLVDVDPENDIVPRLARSWDVSEDGLTYVFHLHEGVEFHDGSPLTAEDVVWTFDRLRDPELPTGDLYANVASIEATGELEVTFTLTETNPFFVYDLSDNRALVVQAGSERPGMDFNGTGPFAVEAYSAGNRMDLVANATYHLEGRPGVERIELVFFSDQVAAVDALRGGQLDLIIRMPTPSFETIEGTPGLETQVVSTNAFNAIRLRADREPGNDPRVMQALRLATDREAIAGLVTLGRAEAGRDSPIGPMYGAYYDTTVPMPARDVEAARALLAEAGYPNGLDLDFHTPDSGDRPDVAVILQEQWAEAGIRTNVIVEPESIYYGENNWLEVTLGLTGWGSRPVPQFYLEVMLMCGAAWNEAQWCDEEFDALARTAGTTLDEDERVAAYSEIQRILIERGPIIVPYFIPQFAAIREEFEGFRLKPFNGRSNLDLIRPR